MRRRIVQILIGIGALYVALCVAARVGYRKLLYPAPSPASLEGIPGTELLELKASDGVPVEALLFPGKKIVVHFHGNGETAAWNVDLGRDLQAKGLGAALVEYRGYGSARTIGPSEEGLYRDAEAVLEALKNRGYGPDKIVLWGTSLGSGVAAEMARRGRGSALVLVTPYTSIPAMARRFAPFLPTGLLVTDCFDTLSKAKEIKVPTLVIHGDKDELIPHAMGVEVSRAIAGAKLVTVPGGTHNDLFVRESDLLLREVVALATMR
jgi:hypothetical protein